MGLLEDIGVELLWFDSLGAKSSSIYIGSKDGGVIIDPGAAAMQPSYPLPIDEKRKLRREAIKRIEESCWRSRIVIITHYHYDHHVLPNDRDLNNPYKTYLGGKIIILKNPNMYINASQWNRARLFLDKLLSLVGDSLREHLVEPLIKGFEDPLEKLVYIHRRDYGDYTSRRMELLERGKKWFLKLAKKLWSTHKWISDDIGLKDNTRILFGDNKTINYKNIHIHIFEPWFHGVEYDRTGWVTPVLINKENYRIFYTSDLMGPVIEDYAYRIADLRPDILIVDGLPTYLFPYMFNRVNLKRAVDNMIYLIENSNARLIIYDHHLLRDRLWRKRVDEVFLTAKRYGIKVLTAAEYLGDIPLIDKLTGEGDQ